MGPIPGHANTVRRQCPNDVVGVGMGQIHEGHRRGPAGMGPDRNSVGPHNDGVPGKLPRRQFLGIAQPQVQLINRVADKWLKEVLDGNTA